MRLCAAAAEFKPEFEVGARTWSLLDGYYIPTCYPNGLPDGIPSDVYTQQASEQAIGLWRDVVEYVTALLSGEEPRTA